MDKYSSIILLVLALTISSYAPPTMCRELKNPATGIPAMRQKLMEEDNSSCWDSLFELQSCTGEIALFLLNGETYLGPNCCSALRTIQGHCWPSMISSVGINSQESDLLMGYCDVGDSGATHRPPPSPPRFTFAHRH